MNSQLRHTEPFHSTSNLTRVGISRRSTGRVSTVGSWRSIRSQTTALDSLDWRLRVAKRIPIRMQSFSKAVAAAIAGLKSPDALTGCQRRVAEEAKGCHAFAMPALVNKGTAAAQRAPSGRSHEA